MVRLRGEISRANNSSFGFKFRYLLRNPYGVKSSTSNDRILHGVRRQANTLNIKQLLFKLLVRERGNLRFGVVDDLAIVFDR